MARSVPKTAYIRVCLGQCGDEGSYLGMEKDGQLILAPGGTDVCDQLKYKFQMEYSSRGLVKFTSCAYQDRVLTAHMDNLMVDGNPTRDGSSTWWNRHDLTGRNSDKQQLSVTDGNNQQLYLYVDSKNCFMIGAIQDKAVEMTDLFQITDC